MPKKPEISKKEPSEAIGRPKTPLRSPIAATDLKKLLAIPAQIDAATQKVLDRLTSFSPVPVAANLPAVETASQNATARLDALLTIFSGRGAQQVLQDMLETGCAPSRKQLLDLADQMIARSAGRAA